MKKISNSQISNQVGDKVINEAFEKFSNNDRALGFDELETESVLKSMADQLITCVNNVKAGGNQLTNSFDDEGSNSLIAIISVLMIKKVIVFKREFLPQRKILTKMNSTNMVQIADNFIEWKIACNCIDGVMLVELSRRNLILRFVCKSYKYSTPNVELTQKELIECIPQAMSIKIQVIIKKKEIFQLMSGWILWNNGCDLNSLF